MEGDSLMPVHLRIETHKRRSERKKKIIKRAPAVNRINNNVSPKRKEVRWGEEGGLRGGVCIIRPQ